MGEVLVKDLLKHKVIKENQGEILIEAIEDLNLQFSLEEKKEFINKLKNTPPSTEEGWRKKLQAKMLEEIERIEEGKNDLDLMAATAFVEIESEIFSEKEEILLKKIYLFALRKAQERKKKKKSPSAL